MTKRPSITAIFKRNLISSEFILLLKNEGIDVFWTKSFSDLKNYKIRKGIIIMEINSQNDVKNLKSLTQKISRNSRFIAVVTKKVEMPENGESLKVLTSPIIFNELLNAIKNSQKDLEEYERSVKLNNYFYYFKSSKLINQDNTTTLKLTDLENKLISFILKSKNGSTKSEILKHVWEHKTELDTHTLESLIYRLRRKIEKDPNNPKILVQVKKRYFLNSSN